MKWERIRAALARSIDPLAALGVRFEPMDGDAWRDQWRNFGGARSHRALVLYVHVPFCARVCSYCLLAARSIPSKGILDGYVDALVRELEIMADIVGAAPIGAMHVGGGTPTALTEAQLDRVLGAARRFARADGFVAGIEAHPGSTTRAKLDVIVRHGISRVSFGVESFTPDVLAAVGRRDQTAERVGRAIEHARAAGIAQINVDLLAGLPRETEETFARTVRDAIDLGVDSMSVNRFLAEGSTLGEFGAGADPDGAVDRMLVDADRIVRESRPPSSPREPLERASYGTQYVWDRDRRRYFQEDMIGPASTLAVGHGGMGHLHGGAYAIAGAPLERWIDTTRRGDAAPVLAWRATERFERAFYVSDRATRGELDSSAFENVFATSLQESFGEDLAFLRERELLREHRGRWSSRASAIELLAFLACDDLDAPPPGPSSSHRVTADDLARMAEHDGPLALDVSAGTSADEAQRLVDAARPLRSRLSIAGADRAAAAQYAQIGDLPPSLVWCRLAICAIRALRALEAQ